MANTKNWTYKKHIWIWSSKPSCCISESFTEVIILTDEEYKALNDKKKKLYRRLKETDKYLVKLKFTNVKPIKRQEYFNTR